MKSFSCAGQEIPYTVHSDKDGLWVSANCPICGESMATDDHGLGEDQAAIVAQSKMFTHMKMAHGVEDSTQSGE